ncbi:MAG: hypothetical protein J6T23_07150 [Elusimicrobia bacterium]|nr:hypothetical protein [Elusimicrobiota bacterium]
MTLLLIILAIVVFALISKFFKNKKIFLIISVAFVLSFYFFLAKNFFHIESFYPTSEIKTYYLCNNFYNLVADALKDKKLYIGTLEEYPKLNVDNVYKNFDTVFEDPKYTNLFDSSYYKGKIYIYFGITPVLLFYLPFNIITSLYLTDKMVVFLLACLSFILSLLLLKKITTSLKFNVQSSIIILSIFLVGLCNYIPFLVIRSCIFEVAILTANVLLLLSFLLLYFFLQTKETTKRYILLILISFCLALAAGARPFYVLHIPLFYCLILLFEYNQNKDIRKILKVSFAFLAPCMFYGIILALYNYLRFDSIFEFGFKYTLNSENHYEQTPSITDALLAIKYNLFQIPDIVEDTIFSLAQTEGHLFANEVVIGVFWAFPLILSFIFFPKFLLNIIKRNKEIFGIIILMLFVAGINLFITSFIGMVSRYFFEYMSLIVPMSLILFYYLYSNAEDKLLKTVLNVYFILLFIYSVFMNMSCLFCEKFSLYYYGSSADNYLKIIGFLFG